MAHLIFYHKFKVQGSGSFPVDMLRYNACYPADTEDAIEMLADHRDEDYNKPRTITLSTLAHKGWEPTNGRWESFGWRVLEHDQYQAINR
jgi:hypothetical protein